MFLIAIEKVPECFSIRLLGRGRFADVLQDLQPELVLWDLHCNKANELDKQVYC